MKTRLLKLSISLVTTAVLSACGASGTTGSVPASHTISAKFLDSAVQNLHYDSLSNVGDTDANGRFTCNLNEEVTFSIGKLTLGKSICQRIVTPQTISATIKQTPVPQTTTSASGVTLSSGSTTQSTVVATAGKHDTEVINRVRLLMSLDTDGDATNGIQLPDPKEPKVSTIYKSNVIPAKMDFKNNGSFNNEASAMKSSLQSVLHNNTSLTDIKTAKSHFDLTLNSEAPNTATVTKNNPAPTKIGQFYNDTTGGFDEKGLEAKDQQFTEKNESEQGHMQEISGK